MRNKLCIFNELRKRVPAVRALDLKSGVPRFTPRSFQLGFLTIFSLLDDDVSYFR